MKRTLRLLTVLLPVLVAATAFAGVEPAPAPEPQTAAPTPAPTPFAAALAAVLEKDRALGAEIAARQAAAVAAGDHAAARAAQDELEQLKSGTELRLLSVQAEFARREGRTEDAARIEDAIATLRLAPPAPQPQERPAPSADAPQR